MPLDPPDVWKIVRFRLMDSSARPVIWAKIEADLVPDIGYAHGYNTLFARGRETRTNEYGMAELALMANDALEVPDSKYLITITYNGKSYRYLIRLKREMPDVIDFEELIDREKLWQQFKYCRDKDAEREDGHPVIIGEKLYL